MFSAIAESARKPEREPEPPAPHNGEEIDFATIKLKSPFLNVMRDRGYLFQCTNIVDLDSVLSSTSTSTSTSNPVTAYLGFDATAPSLHVGSLLQIMILRHYQKCGHKPIVLIGGGTSKVGDPTGKDESRKMMTDEIIEENKRGIKGVFSKFLTFADDASSSSPSSAVLIDNNDWLSNLNYLQFLRDYGPYFTINRMLSFESVKQRMARDAPLSFLEVSERSERAREIATDEIGYIHY